ENPWHGFDVVRKNLRTAREDLSKLLGYGVEVRDQQFDAGARVQLVNLAHRLGVEPGAAVGQVVAGDPGDRRVPQAHGLHTLGDAPRLVGIERSRLARVDLAEVAATGALIAADQEGGLTVFPAFVDVRAARFLA